MHSEGACSHTAQLRRAPFWTKKEDIINITHRGRTQRAACVSTLSLTSSFTSSRTTLICFNVLRGLSFLPWLMFHDSFVLDFLSLFYCLVFLCFEFSHSATHTCSSLNHPGASTFHSTSGVFNQSPVSGSFSCFHVFHHHLHVSNCFIAFILCQWNHSLFFFNKPVFV